MKQRPIDLRLWRHVRAHPAVQLDLLEATGDVQVDAFSRSAIDTGFVLHAPDSAPAAAARWGVGLRRQAVGLQADRRIVACRRS